MDIYGQSPAEVREERPDGRQVRKVGVAESAVSATGQTLRTSGVGSCLAIGLCDAEREIAGLGHPMLPRFADHASPERGKFVDTTIDDLLDDLAEAGARPATVDAVLVGGAQMFDFSFSDGDRESTRSVGPRNVETAEEHLRDRGVDLRAERTGGSVGRSVKLDSATGELTVRTASERTTEVL
ncbi:MAG: chemotaxis protein CheD [Halorientalis sp.]